MNARRVVAVAALLVVNTFGIGANGQESSSAVPADVAEKARGLLDAFNSGEFAALEQYYGTDPEARKLALRDYEMYLVTRGVDVSGMEMTGANRLTITGKERFTGDAVHVILDTARATPRIQGFRLVDAPALGPGGPALSEAEAIAALDQEATRFSEVDEFSGAILITKDGDTIFKKAWGIANKATGAPNRTDTKFNLASCSKMFTAVAILQLAQAGKLSLDDTVGKHLKDYDNKDVRKKVTIRHLLSHTSGLADMFGEEFKARRLELRKATDFISLFETKPLEFEPGTRWRYSNAGFCLLGVIIEEVSGQDYYEYLDEHIFRPAGMINTGAFEMDKPVDNLAIGYTRMGATSPDELRARLDNTDLHNIKGSPAGGSYSTAEDMAKFAAALLNHTLLDEEHLQLAWTPQFQDVRNADPYGLGFAVEEVNGHTVVGHGGGFPGISASFSVYPDDGYVVVVFSNYDRVAQRFAMQMRDWIVAQPVGAMAGKNSSEGR